MWAHMILPCSSRRFRDDFTQFIWKLPKLWPIILSGTFWLHVRNDATRRWKHKLLCVHGTVDLLSVSGGSTRSGPDSRIVFQVTRNILERSHYAIISVSIVCIVMGIPSVPSSMGNYVYKFAISSQIIKRIIALDSLMVFAVRDRCLQHNVFRLQLELEGTDFVEESSQ